MATLNDIGVRGDGGEILQPMIKNRFKVSFNMGDTIDDALTIQAITADKPKLSFEEITLDRYNSRAYIPGKHVFETINVVFESDIGGRVVSILQEQLERQQKLISMASAPRMPSARAGGDLKFGTVIEQLDGDDQVFETWFLDGCWLQNVDFGDLDYAASETVKITATIRFDHARQRISGIEGKAVGGIAINSLVI